MLAAVGVTFLLVTAINRAPYASPVGMRLGPRPIYCKWLDLVALGYGGCDIVPLTGVNRALVAQGLKVMRRRGNIGIAALSDVPKVVDKLDAYHAGFILGPRVQCRRPGRRRPISVRGCSRPRIPAEARELAQHLDVLNAERRSIEAKVLDAAIAQVEQGQHRTDGVRGGRGLASGCHRHRRQPLEKDALQSSRLRRRARRNGIGRGSGRSSGEKLRARARGDRRTASRTAAQWRRSCDGRRFHRRRSQARCVARDAFRARAAEALGHDEPVAELRIDGAIACAAATVDLTEIIDRLGAVPAPAAIPNPASSSPICVC